ncbi:WD40-repeat-containing domain protein [Gorgonomyces haynaldii]|nr:WD40-repeat-containing domain protein [Gorgonomyces haynaldii]
MLGQKEEKDLQQCILQYLKHKGLQSTFESMKKELEMEDDPEYDHLLEIKWSTLNMYEQRVQQSNELTSNSIKSFVGHKMGLTCVKFHPTLDLLFSCGEDQTIRVWDVEDGLQATFTGHSGTVTCLSYRNGLIASSSLDGTLRIWSTHTERLIKHINTDTPLLSVVFMDDETIACGGRDGVLRIIQLDGTVKLLHGHTDPIKALDAKQYLVSADKSIIIWNLDDLSIKGQLFGHEHVIECVHVLESESLPFLQLHGTFLASCSRDKTIRLWNLTTMEHVYTFVF